MKILLAVALTALVIGGCTTTYYHATKGPADYAQDRAECEQIARQSLAAQGIDDC
jgi:PBP1b-binding outer membrane lipoprotein LpoB